MNHKLFAQITVKASVIEKKGYFSCLIKTWIENWAFITIMHSFHVSPVSRNLIQALVSHAWRKKAWRAGGRAYLQSCTYSSEQTRSARFASDKFKNKRIKSFYLERGRSWDSPGKYHTFTSTTKVALGSRKVEFFADLESDKNRPSTNRISADLRVTGEFRMGREAMTCVQAIVEGGEAEIVKSIPVLRNGRANDEDMGGRGKRRATGK